MELQAQSTPERNFSIINPLNFMRAEYNGAMGIPNNCQLFCEAHENGIPLGFSLPILSQILIVLVYKGYLAFVYDYLFNAKKSYYFLWSEYSALVLIAEEPLNNFSIINPLNFIRAEHNGAVELVKLEFQGIFPSHSLPNFDSISL